MSARSRANPWFGPRRPRAPHERVERTVEFITPTQIRVDLVEYFEFAWTRLYAEMFEPDDITSETLT